MYIRELLRNFARNLFGEMPLKENLDLKDYDSYWKEREKGGITGTKERVNRIIRFLGKNKGSLLDIGCGDGAALTIFKRYGFDVEGIDISQKAISLCKRKGLNAKKLDVTKSDLKKRYDYITLLCVLEHIQDAEGIIKKLKGKFNKYLIVAVPNAAFIQHRMRLLLGKFPITSIVFHIKEHIRFWSVSDFKYWANVNGLNVENVISCSPRLLPSFYPSLFATNILYFLRERGRQK